VSWFRHREVSAGVWLIAEPGHVNTWLVEGSERSVLLDTGMGIEPIRPLAEALVHSPVDVVNTHYHFDHTGGNHEFQHIAIHELGAPLLGQTWPRAILDGYLRYIGRLLEVADTYRAIDRQFFHLLSADSDPFPLPETFQGGEWTIRPSVADQMLAEGDRIELGGRALTVIHTPGHSPDSICLLDEENGLLFGADTINTGPIYAQFPDSSIDAFAESVERLAALESQLRLVLVHHFGRAVIEPRFLREVAEGFDRLRANDVELVPDRDCIESLVLRASFGRFSIFVADPSAPARELDTRDAM
jgi:glyoxylase-like metal-dependent hydrolase (beta-lactamase superfamily II)